MKPIHILLAAAVLAAPALAQAQTVFKWVDANGVTNYTTTPPPSSAHKVAAINVAPAVASTNPPTPGDEEARYWRERRLREAADNMQSSRQRQDLEDLHLAQMRQQLAQSYDQEQRAKAEEARRKALYDQCVLERRVDCNTAGAGSGYSYGTPVVVARRSTLPIGTFPVPGTPLLTNGTPGAPSLNVSNGTPGAPSFGSTAPARSTQRASSMARMSSGGAR